VCDYIYILATWIFIAHFEFIVNINIFSLSAVKSVSGTAGQSDCPRDYAAFYVTCWSSSLSFLHAPAFSIPMTISVLHYSLYVCVGTSAYFSLSVSFSSLIFVFYHPFFLYFLPLVFFPRCPSLKLSYFLFIHLVFLIVFQLPLPIFCYRFHSILVST
jgi:hypothetical protein